MKAVVRRDMVLREACVTTTRCPIALVYRERRKLPVRRQQKEKPLRGLSLQSAWSVGGLAQLRKPSAIVGKASSQDRGSYSASRVLQQAVQRAREEQAPSITLHFGHGHDLVIRSGQSIRYAGTAGLRPMSDTQAAVEFLKAAVRLIR